MTNTTVVDLAALQRAARALEGLLTWPALQGTIEKSYIPMWLAKDSRNSLQELQGLLASPKAEGGTWVENAQVILDRCPYTVWQRPGGGPVDLLSTLAVTFVGMQRRLEGHPMYAGILSQAPKHTTKYRTRPTPVEALQWDGSITGMEAIQTKWPNLQTVHVLSHPSNRSVQYWAVKTIHGGEVAHSGDYIIKRSDGFLLCGQAAFDTVYEATND